jgi:hypothetical protein
LNILRGPYRGDRSRGYYCRSAHRLCCVSPYDALRRACHNVSCVMSCVLCACRRGIYLWIRALDDKQQLCLRGPWKVPRSGMGDGCGVVSVSDRLTRAVSPLVDITERAAAGEGDHAGESAGAAPGASPPAPRPTSISCFSYLPYMFFGTRKALARAIVVESCLISHGPRATCIGDLVGL